jgi:hypothetical protein
MDSSDSANCCYQPIALKPGQAASISARNLAKERIDFSLSSHKPRSSSSRSRLSCKRHLMKFLQSVNREAKKGDSLLKADFKHLCESSNVCH